MSDQDQLKRFQEQVERTIDVNRLGQVIIRRWYIISLFIFLDKIC